jgi:hypothetical protein
MSETRWTERGDTHYFVCDALSATAYKGPNEYGDWVWHCEIVCQGCVDGCRQTFWGFEGLDEWVSVMLMELSA